MSYRRAAGPRRTGQADRHGHHAKRCLACRFVAHAFLSRMFLIPCSARRTSSNFCPRIIVANTATAQINIAGPHPIAFTSCRSNAPRPRAVGCSARISGNSATCSQSRLLAVPDQEQ